MALQSENLVMVGLSSLGDTPPSSHQPRLVDGIHLRWTFKRDRGFPWYGYYLFRRRHHSGDPKKVSLDGSGLQPGSTTLNSAQGQLKSDSSLVLINFPPANAVGFDLDRRGYLCFIPAALARRVEAQIGLLQDISDSAPLTITAWLQQVPVAQVRVSGQAGTVAKQWIEFDAISSIEISSGPAVLVELSYVPVADGILAGWQDVPNFRYPMALPVIHPDYPCNTGAINQASAEAMALPRILYGPSRTWAGANFADLHGELVKLVVGGPTATPMSDRFTPPPSPPPEPAMPKQYPLDLILLGALHPAIAQMVGLYWVDQQVNTTDSYDYLIVAARKSALGNNANDALPWLRKPNGLDDVDAFIVFNKSLKPVPPLDAPSGLRTYALPSGSLRPPISSSPRPQNNAGLRWGLDITNFGVLLPGKPVMYHLWRAALGNGENPAATGSYDLITQSGPVLVVEPATPTGKRPQRPLDWPPDRLHYLDTSLADGWYSYQVSGIDIFGRHSPNSSSGPWYQWTPAPDPRPWYYKDPSADSIVHPSAVRLLDTLPPPPPTGIEAYALDPEDPTVLKDAAYNAWWSSLTASLWYQALSEEAKKNFIGLRVRWQWTHMHMRQAPDTNEFRIYYHPEPMNVLVGKSLSVTAPNPNQSNVVTDVSNSLSADAYKGLWLQVGKDAFRIVSSQAGGPLRLTVSNIGTKHEIPPKANMPCLLVIPEGNTNFSHPKKDPHFVDYSVAANWQQRYYVVGYNARASQSLRSALDPKGNKLSGSAAVVSGTTVALDGAPDLSKIRVAGEHIRLASDTNGPDKTYPITSVDDVAKIISVAGTPNIGGAWEIGFPLRTYEIFLPTPDGAFKSSLPLVTSLAEPIKYAHVSVSAADDKTYIKDKRTTGNWANRTGNEGPAGARAKIFRVRREPPSAPEIPLFDSDKVYATPADYHNRSFYTVRWVAAPNVKVHIFRALDESVFRADWSSRSTPFVLSATDSDHLQKYFPAELRRNDPATIARRNDVASKLNGLNNISRTATPDDVRAAYRALTNDALRVLAGLPGSERAFTQLTIRPLDPQESDPDNPALLRWRDRIGPDNPSSFATDATLRSYMDTLDGRSTNSYFYRAGSVDGSHNRSEELSLSSPPVYCPDVVPPIQPSGVRAMATNNREITLTWTTNREADLKEYWIYRGEIAEDAEDTRLMTRVGSVSPNAVDPAARAPTETWADQNVVGGRTYHYRVVAMDGDGNGSVPSAITTTRAYDATPPEPPALTAGWNVVQQRVNLSWAAAGEDFSYMVERYSTSRPEWRPISAWLAGTTGAFHDAGVASGETYTYRLWVARMTGEMNTAYLPSAGATVP